MIARATKMLLFSYLLPGAFNPLCTDALKINKVLQIMIVA